MPEGYLPRLVDEKLSDALDLFGAVEVAGTMWCGKTWTSMAFGESISRIGTNAVRTTAEADPSTALLGTQPHVIDEWQDVPAIWDEVRAAVDETGGRNGQFILTGSSRPAKEMVHHSGAGRIQTIRMRTMSLVESGQSSGKVSLSGLFSGAFEPVLVQQKLPPLAETICRGGWPGLVGKGITDSNPFLDSYLDALFNVSIPRKGLVGSNAKRVALSLARNLGSSVKLSTVADDSGFAGNANKVSEYIGALEELYVVEALRGWDAPIRSKSRLRIKPKYYFADPSLAACLLSASPSRIMDDGQLFGVLFESLCIHDLSVYASIMPDAGADHLRFYKDSDGLEVDAVLELRDGRWAAFEIKLGENRIDEAAKALNRLKAKVLLNPAARNRTPEFLAVIVGAGEAARYDRDRGVYVIPITALGA